MCVVLDLHCINHSVKTSAEFIDPNPLSSTATATATSSTVHHSVAANGLPLLPQLQPVEQTAVELDDDPFVHLEQLICADHSSEFAVYYQQYSQGFLQGDDSKFRNAFCRAYQAMTMIGLQVPADYLEVSRYKQMLYSAVCIVLREKALQYC
jgi:hypothetical protein